VFGEVEALEPVSGVGFRESLPEEFQQPEVGAREPPWPVSATTSRSFRTFRACLPFLPMT
jgi:hypothetical protein